MKKLVKLLLGIAGVFALVIAAIFYFTAEMAKTADEFFAAIADKDPKKAYTYLTEDFKATTSQSELEAYFKNNLIHKFKEAHWDSRSIKGGRGSLIGSIATESGGVVPITLSLVKSENGWKIYSIQKPSAGILEESSPVEMPSEQVQVQFVSESMKIFAESVNDKGMAKFHAHVSNLWQQQFTIEKLDEAFGSFYSSGVDLTVLDSYSPQFSAKPSIDDKGVLVIAGHYPTEPKQVHFEQKYIYEGLGWKLLGFSTKID